MIIAPICKGDKENIRNYRSILLISLVAKTCEKVIKNLWMNFLEMKELNQQTIWF